MGIESDFRPKQLPDADKGVGGAEDRPDNVGGKRPELELKTRGKGNKPVIAKLRIVEDGLNEVIEVRPYDKNTSEKGD